MEAQNIIRRDFQRRDGRKYICDFEGCGSIAYSQTAFDRHTIVQHQCYHCSGMFTNVRDHRCEEMRDEFQDQRAGAPTQFNPAAITSQYFRLVEFAHDYVILQFRHDFEKTVVMIEMGIETVFSDMTSVVQQTLHYFKGMKMRLRVVANMLEPQTNHMIEAPAMPGYMNVLHSSDVERSLNWQLNQIIRTFNAFCEQKSGYRIDRVVSIEINMGRFRADGGGTYIERPAFLKRKRSLVNIRTREKDNCFMLSVLAFFYYNELRENFIRENEWDVRKKNHQYSLKWALENPKHYEKLIERSQQEHELDFTHFTSLVRVEDVDRFELLHDKVSVNLYGCEDRRVFAIRLTRRDVPHHINLLLLTTCEDDGKKLKNTRKSTNVKQHYVLIRNLDSFLSDNKNREAKFCIWCLRSITENSRHPYNCRQMVQANLKTFPARTKFEFRNRHMKLDTLFRCYYDLECYSIPYEAPNRESDNPDALRFTRVKSNYEVCAFGIAVIHFTGTLVFQEYYCGKNPMERFYDTLFRIKAQVQSYHENHALPLNPTADDEELFRITTLCESCSGPFTEGNVKVRHHHHFDPRVPISIVCNNCNLNMQQRRILPVLGHNSTNFDAVFLIKSLSPAIQENVTVLSRNSEKILSFSIGNQKTYELRFLDSCLFLTDSLEKLVNRLKGAGTPQDLKRFDILYKGFNNHKYTDMLLGKQFFPFEWCTSEEKLRQTSLPSRADFANKLNMNEISDDDHKHAQLVWERFDCRTFKDYLLLYQKCDVLLLAAVFEHFVRTMMETYELSPVYCYSLPGYSYQVANYLSKERWEFPSDIDLIEMIRANIRGGITYCAQREATSLTENLGDKLEDGDERQQIFYTDLNSLYATCLLQPMPFKHYNWLEEEDIADLDIPNLREDSGEGWIFEVDLVVPPHLHDKLNSLPPAPDRMKVELAHLSKFQRSLYNLHRGNIPDPFAGAGVDQLLLTFHKKEKYAVYYKLLKLYLRLGLQITKIHRVCYFEEKPFFRSYIQGNLDRRRKSTDEFSKSMYKLMSNACFGFLLNLKVRMITKFCSNRIDALRYLASHNFKEVKVLTKDSSLFFFEGEYALVNRPYIAGYCVLELSKYILYSTYYEKLLPVLGSNMTNIYSDTDSLILLIKDPGNQTTVYEKLRRLKDVFDFSKLHPSHPLYSTENQGVPGLLKIEYANVRQFLGLKSKCYSVLLQCMTCRSENMELGDDACETCKGKIQQEMKAKGIPKKLVRTFTHQLFWDYLHNNKVQRIVARRIRPRNYEMQVVEYKKIGLHNFDIRRYIMDDGVHTLAYGHISIPSHLNKATADPMYDVIPTWSANVLPSSSNSVEIGATRDSQNDVIPTENANMLPSNDNSMDIEATTDAENDVIYL